jgi:alpha-tubulin suppressor-like RCC1 family protein
VSEWVDIVAISAGGRHTLGLRSDGTIVTTGSNAEGQRNVSDWQIDWQKIVTDQADRIKGEKVLVEVSQEVSQKVLEEVPSGEVE